MRKVKIKPLEGQKIEALSFDLGGVLLNLDFNKTFDAFIKLGFENVEQDLARFLLSQPAGNNISMFHKYEKGLISSARFREALREHTGINFSDNDIDRAWAAMLQDLHEENVKLLETLKNSFRIFLLSNTNAIHIRTLHGRNYKGTGFPDLVGYFEKVYYSHQVNMRKPDQEIFDHVIQDAGLTGANTLFIDDSIHNVEAARKAGLHAYHHKAGASLAPVFQLR
jgi:glucose-1-phosphatase